VDGSVPVSFTVDGDPESPSCWGVWVAVPGAESSAGSGEGGSIGARDRERSRLATRAREKG